MASSSQNFTKFQKDSFEIVFTITDASDISDWEAWWGVWSGTPDTWNGSQQNTPFIYKATNGWESGPNSPNYKPPRYNNISDLILLSTNTATITIQQQDFIGDSITNVLYEGDWYHELVLSPTPNASNSVVVATGTMTISPSLFTNNLFRWIS